MTYDVSALAREPYCYLTTTGRITGRPHTIEIWFVMEANTIYMLSGKQDAAHWVKNALLTPDITIRIKDQILRAGARRVRDNTEDALARRLLYGKYSTIDADLKEWAQTALPMAFDLN